LESTVRAAAEAAAEGAPAARMALTPERAAVLVGTEGAAALEEVRVPSATAVLSS
jgi:hypothetical protein